MVNNYRHSLQSAIMALRDGLSEEDVVVCLLHDIGFSPPDHAWRLRGGADGCLHFDPDYLAGNRMIGPNRWPQYLPEMRPLLNTYLAAAHDCARTMLRALAVSLNAPEDTFVRCFDKPISRASLIYYPPQDAASGEQQFGVAPHTDYGVITLLHQDPSRRPAGGHAQGRMGHRAADSRHPGDQFRRPPGALDQRTLQIQSASRGQQFRA